MSKLPQISGADAVAALKKAGFYVKRQQGSHIVLRHNAPFAQTVVPNHRVLDRGTLRAIIRQVGLSVDESKRCCELVIDAIFPTACNCASSHTSETDRPFPKVICLAGVGGRRPLPGRRLQGGRSSGT